MIITFSTYSRNFIKKDKENNFKNKDEKIGNSNNIKKNLKIFMITMLIKENCIINNGVYNSKNKKNILIENIKNNKE